jgi:hypothetical protein
MELTYQQVLAEVYEETSKNILVHQTEYDGEDKPAYEEYDYEANDLPDPEEFNTFHGDRNKPEHVIKPDVKHDLGGKSGVKHPTDVRTIVLNIDGAFRGNIVPQQLINCDGSINEATFSIGTDPSQFTFNTNRLYKNISSVKLTSMEFMNSFYTFSKARGNTTFYITLQSNLSTQYTIGIPDGNYSTHDIFASTIEHAVVAIPALSGFTVEYNPISHAIILTGTAGFIVNFPVTETNQYGNGIGYNMGFINKTYSTGIIPIIGSDTALNLFQDTYVYLQINDWNLLEHQIYGQTYYSVFAKIQLNGAKNTIIYDNNYTNSSTKEYVFQQPVNISRLEIRMLDAYGNTLDLRGGSFSMTIELHQVNNSGVYEKLLEL